MTKHRAPSAEARSRRETAAGFTMLELMITTAVIAILAALAYPSYKNWVDSGRRADGTAALLDLANRMQRYYAENNTYVGATIAAGTATDVISSATTPQGYYTLDFGGVALTATTYILRATTAGVQVNDTRCGNLTLTSANVKSISGTATVDQCW